MKILVPLDGSDRSLDALRHAFNLHREGLRLELVLAAVQEPTYVYEMVLAPDAEVLERVGGVVGSRMLEPARAMLAAAGLSAAEEIGVGEVATTLIEMAERFGCEAIIIGARGRGALRSALLGSVSSAVLRMARLPVTIVKHVAAATDAS